MEHAITCELVVVVSWVYALKLNNSCENNSLLNAFILSTKGYGEMKAVAGNSTEEEKEKNKREEFAKRTKNLSRKYLQFKKVSVA